MTRIREKRERGALSAASCALLALVASGALAQAPASDAAEQSPAAPEAKALPEPLGARDYLPVAPGHRVGSSSEVLGSSVEGSSLKWTERARRELSLKEGKLLLLLIELPGSGAGLVILAPEQGAGFKVVNTYGVEHDGLGVEMNLRDQWVAEDRGMAIILIESARESRGYYARPGDEDSAVAPSISRTWLAIGLAPQRAWLAAPPMEAYSRVWLAPRARSLQLLGCQKETGPTRAFDFNSATGSFSSARITAPTCRARPPPRAQPR